MGSLRYLIILVLVELTVFLTTGCSREIGENISTESVKAVIEPEYTDVTIPPNIAPMNFSIKENGASYRVVATSGKTGFKIVVNSADGIIRFPLRKWRKLIAESVGDSMSVRIFSFQEGHGTTRSYKPFSFIVANDSIDPYIAYRLIKPGYYSWSHIRIVQRSVESFSEEPLFDNQIMEKNCANCHSFNKNSADRFMIHIRGSLGGTYFYENGKVTRTDPRIDAMPGSATYPTWHPGGKFLAFSSNQVRQSFYSVSGKNIEVFDQVSSLILYDIEKNEILNINDIDTTRYLQTFPSWSPDGKFLYFCRAPQYKSGTNPDMEELKSTFYDLARKPFDEEKRTFGETEIVFRASEISKSVSFPRISPEGRFLVFTLADYGTFPVWHREADLYSFDLNRNEVRKMDINSEETESYHTWSLNSRWLVFSSRRIDGRSSRPYFAHIDSTGKQGKEFVLPQKDPTLYNRMLESFNIPEFVNGKIDLAPKDLARASKQIAAKTKPGNRADKVPSTPYPAPGVNNNERPIHE